MDEINKIRKAFFKNGESKHKIAKRLNRSWDTIDRIVRQSREELEKHDKNKKRQGSVITPNVIEAIEEYLMEEIEKKIKKKQRYTAKTIYQKLKERGIYNGSLRRIEVNVKSLREKHLQTKQKSFLPLNFPLGSAIQIDHGEVYLKINEVQVKGYLFVAVVPGKVLRYCQCFPIKSKESWGEFHEKTFRFLGGTFPKVIYDNDSVLVKEIIGDERKQTNFSLELEEKYEFESHFCNPASGNEKGAVENAVGYCRRNFLPGIPVFDGWDEVNNFLETVSMKSIKEGKHYKTNENLIDIFEKMKGLLGPLTTNQKWRKWIYCRVDRCQLITVNKNDYSVPEKYVGTYVRVSLTVFQVEVFKDDELIASHKRIYGNEDSLLLDHYLDQLQYKSSAFWDCKAVYQHKFDPILTDMWNFLCIRYDKKYANRQFVQILLLGKQYGEKLLLEAIELCLMYNAFEYPAVENIIRQLETNTPVFNEKELKDHLKGITIDKWGFDLSPYAVLCDKEATL